MPSSTKNVKLGVCKVTFDGFDLGYTKGGVEVTVKTETHKIQVDQFGKSVINETIIGREVMAKVPMAETTLENMVAIMPGATLVQTGGAVATGTLTVATQPAAGFTVTINGTVVTFRASLATFTGVGVEVLIGASVNETAANLAAALNASGDERIGLAYYSVSGAVVTVRYGNEAVYGVNGRKGAEGNAFTLVSSGAAITVSGATLTGGTNPTAERVDVTHGIGTDLLSIARELRFHPINKPSSDRSEDFVIPLAATPGAIDFAYKLEDERVYNVEYMGYPDSVTGKLFVVGA